MSTAKIIFISGTDRCEDCGFYDWYKIQIKVDTKGSKYIKEYSGDSHLGGGVPSPEDFVEGYNQALLDLGFIVILEKEYKPYNEV